MDQITDETYMHTAVLRQLQDLYISPINLMNRALLLAVASR